MLHYLDDFFTARAANADDCMNNLTAMLSLCKKINAPVKSSKVEGPSTSLTFLGILLNTTTMEASITQERKQVLLSELAHLRYRRNCTKRALLSLIGKLSFGCKVLPAGRIFLRRLVDLGTMVPKLHYHLPLTAETKLDLQWWLNFLPQWSGKSLILQSNWFHSDSMQLYTDASGTQGWGAYWSGRWLQHRWSPAQHLMNIAWKELFAILPAVHSWGTHWIRQKIVFHCDNQAVVDIWEKGTTRDPILWLWYVYCTLERYRTILMCV